MDFPWNHPMLAWGTPLTMETRASRVPGTVLHASALPSVPGVVPKLYVAPSPWYVGRYPWPWPLWIGKTYGKTHDSIIHWMMYPPYALFVQSLSNKPMSQDWSNCYQTGGDFDSLIIVGAWGSASDKRPIHWSSWTHSAEGLPLLLTHTYSMAMTGHGAAKRCDFGISSLKLCPK